MDRYSSVVLWSEQDKCFIATCPEFEYLSAFGDTQEEALAELRVARQLVIDVMKEAGQSLPVPQEIEQYSGKLRLRLPKSLHRRAVEAARRDDASLNQFIVAAVAERVGAASTMTPSVPLTQNAFLAMRHKPAQVLYGLSDALRDADHYKRASTLSSTQICCSEVCFTGSSAALPRETN